MKQVKLGQMILTKNKNKILSHTIIGSNKDVSVSEMGVTFTPVEMCRIRIIR